MQTRSQNTRLNVALKVAIIESRLKSQDVARRIRITPVRLSHIVHGRRPAKASEQKALARVLDRHVADLFPVELVA